MNRPLFLTILLIFGLVTPLLSATDSANPAAAPAIAGDAPALESLLNLMVSKGVLSATEVAALRAKPGNQQLTPLLALLAQKGVITQTELAAISPVATPSSSPTQTTAQATPVQASVVPTAPKPPDKPAVIAAVAPLRVLPVDPPKKDGLVPDLKLGPVKVKPYGMIKASVIYDTSSPRGDDMPINFFVFGDTGPDKSPEFRVKARFLRIGSNFEWPDVSKKLTLTGRLEFDFEGNFTKTDNRNISTVRSSQASIRQAWGRFDYAVDETNTLYALAGQDWTPFGSSTLPNLIETTGLGLGFGTLYERAPLAKVGWVHDFGGARKWKFMPEFAIVLPAYGNTPSAPDVQLSIGERQGTDSGRPDLSGRFVTQFQLDKAPAVAPAQLIVSWVQGRRESIVKAADVPAAYKSAFPTGARVGNDRWGVSGEVQLPTRYVTILGKWFSGTDLRWYFVGELFSHYNVPASILNATGVATAPSIDGSDTVAFGMINGVPTILPQNGVRTTGGFVNLGFPLSRIFHANPAGRHAGWSAYLHYSLDEAKARDVRKFSSATGNRWKSDILSANLQWKLNPFVTLALEESQYRTYTLPNDNGVYPLYGGVPSSSAKTLRTEFSTIFTF
ncbi:MAG TPA: hypothetical protein VN577_17585 [Terriglobales bacterium]|nr:hypothetical protein [Terriglobales bacterium]